MCCLGRAPASPTPGPAPARSVIGAEDVLALGDASLFVPERLPATAQVAGQQGAYAAHLVNRGFTLGMGGMDQVGCYAGQAPTTGCRRAAPAKARACAPIEPVPGSPACPCAPGSRHQRSRWRS